MGNATPAQSTFDIDAKLRTIARSQRGLITYQRANAVGVDKHALARRRNTGALVEVFPGVMMVDPVVPTIEQRILAAALAVPGSIVTGTSAAIVHGLPVSRRDGEETSHRPVLCIDRSRRIRLNGIRTLRHVQAPPSRRWMTVRLATPAATLLTLPRYVSAGIVERCLDHAVANRLVTVRALRSTIDSIPTAGFVGRRLLVGLLDERSQGMGHRSGLEQRVGRWLRESGIRGWRRNLGVCVGDGVPIEVDFAWMKAKVGLEVSPFFTHGSKVTQERDAERRRLLVGAGWRIIEATDRDLENAREFRRVTQSLRSLLASA